MKILKLAMTECGLDSVSSCDCFGKNYLILDYRNYFSIRNSTNLEISNTCNKTHWKMDHLLLIWNGLRIKDWKIWTTFEKQRICFIFVSFNSNSLNLICDSVMWNWSIKNLFAICDVQSFCLYISGF